MNFKRYLNLDSVLKEHNIEFRSEEKKISWIKRMRPSTLVRIGSSYFIDEKELDILMKTYFTKQIALRKKRATLAKKNFTKPKKQPPLFNRLL